MTLSEKQKRLGFVLPEDKKEAPRTLLDDRRPQNIKSEIDSIDWAAAGKTGPVKNQGGCGSCYVFSSNTVLEATIAIETGKPYQHLSEQQIVDCAHYDDTQYYEAATHLGKHNTLKWNSNDEIQTLRIREAYKTLTVGGLVPLL